MDIALIVVIIVFLIPIGFLIKSLIPYFTTKEGLKKYNKEMTTEGPKLMMARPLGIFLGLIITSVILWDFDLIIELFKKYPFVFIFLIVLSGAVFYYEYYLPKKKAKKSK